jgi:outer membrane protein OmpA-like peptidoglycan-associated protein
MKEYPSAAFVIEGHTDSQGRETTNQKLSDSRAAAVRDYLTTIGMEGSRLSSIGYGESRPIASNSTKAGRQQNRRVEISLRK